MNFARREPRWAVTLTLLVGLILQVLPLPDFVQAVRPSFIALVIVYWGIYSPHAGGIFAPFVAGLALDVFKGEVLGQNALAAITVAYIAMSRARPAGAAKRAERRHACGNRIESHAPIIPLMRASKR